MLGVWFARAKWVTIPLACVTLFVKHRPVIAILALCTPLVAAILPFPATVPLGPIEELFYRQMGVVADLEIRDKDIPF